MATTLVVSFVMGRYHATPWGRHVNEGSVELPPSPWRLLRALYAVWKTRAPDLDAPTVIGLFGRLAEPPTYFVPPFRLAHTRHYYPDSQHRTGSTPSVDRTLDAFAVFAHNAELGIRWPFDLEPEQHKAFERLASSLPYLGRADSVCEARVVENWTPPADAVASGPVDVGESVPSSTSVIRLLCPSLPLDVEALTDRPVDVRAGRLLFPSGTRFVGYLKPVEHAIPARTARPAVGPVQAVRFSVLNRVLPALNDMVTLTHLLRQTVLNKFSDQHPAYWWFAGKDPHGQPLHGHNHPHYLALPDERHRVGELAVWLPNATNGSDDVLQRLSGVRRLWRPHDGGRPEAAIAVRLSSFGTVQQVLPEYAGESSSWVSATPFVPTGHRKGEWQEFLRRRLIRELAYREHLPADAQVTLLRGPGVRVAPRRPYEPGTHVPTPTWLRIEFAQPVPGPVVLGRLAHFGLGLFKVDSS
ncbi:type I-G CRISPR-associated protein Csb2 [Phytoactinopolyspora limicola]|uniref:type I-G CRISPR-associated protein Csb2 n=1 Tax=Phytoactinopolyspora limicola TaxID=2715536 RepID=UPI0014092B6C|nr:type I-U CRISPR-associated protein Csb2 [Phytoactinopolyspora limicola]